MAKPMRIILRIKVQKRKYIHIQESLKVGFHLNLSEILRSLKKG